ncbi:MAG: arginine N-succinyltransferase [Parachlamydiaceae bacterium]
MYVLRAIELQDEEAFIQLAMTANLGILSLPHNSKRLRDKFHHSVETFSHLNPPFAHGNYIFVLENLETKRIEGCSAISTTTEASDMISHCYKIEISLHPHRIFDYIPAEQKMLFPHVISKNASEIGSLFLSKQSREEGLGRLLSLGRFLFIASHPHYFQDEIIAEMRGVIDPSGKSPFWEGVGRHFCNVDIETISRFCEENPFIGKDIQPQHPIYLNLLPQEVQDVIGKTHINALPALKMLIEQGFAPFNAIDIFDAGPKISASTKHIKTIRETVHTFVKAITTAKLQEEISKKQLVATTKQAFRACYGELKMKDPSEGATLSIETAKALQIDVGESISFTEIDLHKDAKMRGQRVEDSFSLF